MKILILTDQHFMYKKSSKIYMDYMLKFYNNVLFPYIENNNISIIIDCGDTTDNRKFLELDGIYRMKTEYYDKLKHCTIHTIVGNHQTFYKNSNYINTPELILKEYENITVYPEITTINIDELDIDLIPWINENNFESTQQYINQSTSKIAIGHLEITSATMFPGHFVKNGTDPILFEKYSKVLSGHLHFRHQIKNIYYIGNVCQLNRGDEGAIRGFAVLDTDTLKVEYVNNPYKLFKTIYYNDSINDYNNFDILEYQDTFTKLVVEERNDICTYDVLVSKLYEVCHELKIIEKNIVDNLIYSNTIDIEQQDTITVFSEYIDSMNIDNVDELKSIIRGVYAEASL